MQTIAAESVMVIVLCRDGKLRQVPLTTKQSSKVRRVVTHLHGGEMRVNPEDILIMSEADALETFGKLTGQLPFRERWKRRLKFFTKRPQRNAEVVTEKEPLCDWPGCTTPLLCTSGNVDGACVCPAHFKITNGKEAGEYSAKELSAMEIMVSIARFRIQYSQREKAA